MKIALVVPEFPPDSIGGGGAVFESLAQHFSRRHAVRVFSAWDSVRSWRKRGQHTAMAGFDIYRYSIVPLGTSRPYLRSVLPPNPLALQELRRDLASWAPEVGHLHGYGHAFIDLAARWFRKSGVPFLFSAHGVPVSPFSRGIGIRTAFGLYRRLGPEQTVSSASLVTAVSTDTAEKLGAFEHPEVIPNGITPLPATDPFRVMHLLRKLGIPSQTPVIAAAGRLAAAKGFDVLIKALEFLPSRPLSCVIAGDDAGELDYLRSLVGRLPKNVSVHFPGKIDRQELADLFDAANVVAIPSRDEPFGLVGLEALAAGRRIVATSIGGLREFLPAGLAELVPSDDAGAMARALERALDRGLPREEEIESAKEVLMRHAWDPIALRYETLLRAALAHGMSGRNLS